ncbi:NUDIX hydrolase [Fictibacillus aquaticus]|uniref:DNA mismatch repair protein MutT n=1 Tax=Fictibacillus aquaticus TaxID=2021314 RepID=A0A235FDI2_9BACL|nr:DNA mismatch repair protein MutT [Fictibacillus aquaticus]
MKRVDVAYTVLVDETSEKVLMVKNRGEDGSYFTLPGGAVEKGETLQEAAIREAREETGLSVEVGGLLNICEAFFEKRGHHAVFFTFVGKVTGGHIHISMPDEIEEVVWMDMTEAKKFIFGGESWTESISSQPAVPYVLKGTV